MRKLRNTYFALLFVSLLTWARAADCGCASPLDRVKIGFKQVAHFAGKITAKFYLGGQMVDQRVYTAGTVVLNGSQYQVQSYGCGEFADTVFITAAIGQPITIQASFVDDPTSPDYTEMDPSDRMLLTVTSLPSASCLNHFADVGATGTFLRVIPGVGMATPPVFTNSATTQFVTYGKTEDTSGSGSGAGPGFGLLTAPPARADFQDAQPLDILCGTMQAMASMTLAATDTRTATTSNTASSNVATQTGKGRGSAGLVARAYDPRKAEHRRVDDPLAAPGAASKFTAYWSKRSAGKPTGRAGLRVANIPPVPNWLKVPVDGKSSIKNRPAQSGPSATASPTTAISSSISVTTMSAAVPGSVVQQEIGALNMAISLGYQEGKLLYVTPAINVAAYSPTNLHLSDDAKPLRVITDALGALRQVSLAQSFLDVRTVSASAFEVRFYLLSQVGAFDGTLFPISNDAPYCVWRIENPDATNAGRIRFAETRGGQTTAHLAQWQAASGDTAGTMTVAYNNEAEIETRTYYLYTSPYARGERIQRRAGPLASPGVVVADSFDAYREFYNWSTTGEIFQALVEHTDDPAGAALTTSYVYYDTTAVAPRSLNGVTYPDGYWERYGRFSDGTVSRIYRPIVDNPASPDAATTTNCLVTDVTYPATGDPTLQIEVTEEHAQGVLVRHDEIYRQFVGDAYFESNYRYLDAGNFTQSRTISTARNGLILQANDSAGNFQQYSYEAGFWQAAAETFVPAGSGTPARRAVEVQGSLTHTGGVANQTLVRVMVRDGFDRTLLEEIYVNNGAAFVPGLRSDWITRIVNSYDARGLLVAQTRNGRTVYEAGYDADGRVSFTVDDLGVRTEYTYDGFGRVSSTVKKRGASATDQTTTLAYDAAGRTRFQTITAGALSSTTESRYDVAGRGIQVISPEGLVQTTSELFYVDGTGKPARREVTVTSPSGATTIEEYYRDRSLFYKHGTGVASEYWGHSYSSPNGFKLDYFYRQLSDTNPLLYQVANWRGDNIQSSQLNFGGTAAVNRFSTYNGGAGADGSVRGLLAAMNVTGQVANLFEYDEFGRRSAEGVDANGNGLLDRASGDPITTHSEVYAYDEPTSAWSRVLQDYRCLSAGSSATTLQSETREALTGLAAGVVSDRTVLDASGGRRRESVSVDRPTLTRTTVTRNLAADASSQPETRTEIGGLLRTLRRAEANADVTYSYDALDRMQVVNDPTSGPLTYAYNASGQVGSVTDSLSRSTSFTYHPTGVAGAGQTATQQDADGKMARYSYTVRNQLYRQWGTNVYPTEYTYDDQSRLTGLRTFRTTDSNVDWSQASWPASLPVSGDLTRWTFDYSSGLLASKIYADNRAVTYAYDASLRTSGRTNGRNQATAYGYDTLGRLTTVTYPSGSGMTNVTYGYDRANRLATVDDGSGARTLTYSDFDQLKNETYSSGPLAGIAIARTFDAQNRAATLGASNGGALNLSSSYGYDALSRLGSITYPSAAGGSMSFVYGYAAGTSRVETLSSRQGSATIATGTRTYDNLGRFTGISTANGAGAVLLSHGYTQFDALDRRKKVIREDGKEWNYDYNSRGEVTGARKQFSAAEGGELLAGWQSSFAYDAIGNRVTAAFGGDATGANLRQGSYTTNLLNQYTQRTVPGSVFFTGEADPAATVDVSVNEAPVPSLLRQGAAGAKRFFSAEFQADNTVSGIYGVSRIRAALSGSSPVGQMGWFYLARTPEAFSYDLDGNLTSDDRWNYTWDVENRLVAIETRPDRLRSTGPLPLERRLKLEFVYDAQGRRVQKKVSTWSSATNAWTMASDLRFVYDRWNCLADLSVQGATTSMQCAYVWGLDLSGSLYGAGGVGGLLAQTTTTVGVAGDYVYAYDGNGNVAALIGASSGAFAAEYDYGPFGEVLKGTGAMADLNRYRFSTKCEDETGLCYYGYRYYVPIAGRWLSKDPIGEAGGVNLYGFGWNDATNTWDILGLVPPGSPLRGDTTVFLEVMTEMERQAVRQVIRESAELATREAARQAAAKAFAAAAAAAVAANAVGTDTRKCDECLFTWHFGRDRGGNADHTKYAFMLSAELGGPVGNVDVTTPEGVTTGYDGAGPAGRPKIAFEAKTRHDWMAGENPNPAAVASRQADFALDVFVAVRCKLLYRIYFNSPDAYNGFRKHLPEFKPFYVFHP